MATAATYDVIIDQGATWNLAVQWLDSTGNAVDLTGFDVRAQLRTAYADQGGVILADLTIGDGVTVTDPAEGKFLLTIDAATTESIRSGTWRWDCEAQSGPGEVTRLLMGKALVRGEVTR